MNLITRVHWTKLTSYCLVSLQLRHLTTIYPQALLAYPSLIGMFFMLPAATALQY